MKHIICFSGGWSSAETAAKVVAKYGKEDVILINHECKLEDDDNTRFENEVASYLGLQITYVNFNDSATKDQFDVVIEKKSFINTNSPAREALCTHVMKTEPFMNWLSLNFPIADTLFNKKKDCIVYYGFDKTEPDRIQRRSGIMGAQGYKTGYPSLWDMEPVLAKSGINAPDCYKVYKHANCKGCLKAGWQHWYCVYVLEPAIYAKGEHAEDVIGYTIHKDCSLNEKREMFDKMIDCGIQPTEKISSATWWAYVKKILKETYKINIKVQEEDTKPCECLL